MLCFDQRVVSDVFAQSAIEEQKKVGDSYLQRGLPLWDCWTSAVEVDLPGWFGAASCEELLFPEASNSPLALFAKIGDILLGLFERFKPEWGGID